MGLLSRVRRLMRDDAASRDRDRPPEAGHTVHDSTAPRPRAAQPTVSTPRTGATGDLAQLEAAARYHRDRAALYRARVHGPKPTSASRLRELERKAAAADDRLRRAKQP
jgi:hypothetical protein